MQREAEAHEVEAQVHRDPTPEPDAMPRVEQARIEEARVQEPRIEQPRFEQPVQAEAPRYEAPRIDAKEILTSSGLQMVETDASKARQPVPEPEPVRLGRPRREKPVPSAAETELVQVETHNK